MRDMSVEILRLKLGIIWHEANFSFFKRNYLKFLLSYMGFPFRRKASYNVFFLHLPRVPHLLREN